MYGIKDMTEKRMPRFHPRRKILDSVFSLLLLRAGLDHQIRNSHPDSLTVLNYHRINNPAAAGFDTFKPNVSATPTVFNQHLSYLKKRFNLVTAREIAGWMHGKNKLPPNAALITFDDGYYDNLAEAYPLLKAHQLSALIFLTTDFVGKLKPSYWDTAAYCFYHTQQDYLQSPLTGLDHWENEFEKESVMIRWIEKAKTLLESEKSVMVQKLPGLLGVDIPDGTFSKLFLTSSQVRDLINNGIEIGSHTVSHPILTCIPVEQVRTELTQSKNWIEEETGRMVDYFAYPNGQTTDFNEQIITEVQNAGYKLAFTLLSGSNPYNQIKQAPYTLKRIFLSYRDSFPRFVAKVNEFPNLPYLPKMDL